MASKFYEHLLCKLIKNGMDLFEVLFEAGKLKLDLGCAVDFSHKKYLLQKKVILQLLKVKEGSEKRRLEKVLETTNKFLKLKMIRVIFHMGIHVHFLHAYLKEKDTVSI